MYKVDATGLSCPEPLILLKRALKDNAEVLLIVDNKVCVETCSRFTESKGFSIAVTEKDRTYELSVRR